MIVDSKEGERECVVFERKGVERVSYSMRNVSLLLSLPIRRLLAQLPLPLPPLPLSEGCHPPRLGNHSNPY